MKCRHDELIPDAENPFAQCKLDREQYAEVLTQIVQNYSDGFVLSVNGSWGTGKTTFVKMWKQYMENNGLTVAYFNAWENDFISDPLTALLGEINALIKPSGERTLENAIKAAGKIACSSLGKIAKLTLKSILGGDVADAVEAIIDRGGEIVQEEILEYEDKKKQMINFRNEITTYLEAELSQKPMVIIVDELDRCRPDYAVEVLERIKHLFSVKGIVFVLAIDKIQLCNAIKGYYGSEHIDANEYLRRFIDLEYILPEPSRGVFCRYLYRYFGLNAKLGAEDYDISGAITEGKYLLDFLDLFTERLQLTLRQIEKLMAHMRLMLCTLGPYRKSLPRSTFLLIYLKSYMPELYEKIAKYELSLQDLASQIVNVFPHGMFDDENSQPTALNGGLAEFIYMYCKGGQSEGISQPITSSSTPTLTFGIQVNAQSFASQISHYQRRYADMSNWNYLIRSINMTNNLLK